MDDFTMKVEGFAQLEADFAAIERVATSRGVARRSLVKSAQPMVALMRAKAPRLTGALVEAINVRTRVTGGEVGRRAFFETMRGGGTRGEALSAMRAARRSEGGVVEVFAGAENNAAAYQQELGNENHPPQPWARPAFDEDAEAFIERLRRTLGEELDKTLRRIGARSR
jgi:hypothetical protein